MGKSLKMRMSIIKPDPRFLKYCFVILGIIICIASMAHATNYTFIPIEAPDGSLTEAYGINSSDNIVGISGQHGFLYIGGTFTQIDFPGAWQTQPYGINDFNNIVGAYLDAAMHGYGFLYDGGNFTPINLPAASETYALGINNSNHIVGHYRDTTSAVKGFIYADGVFKSINYPDASLTVAFGINKSGSIVGCYRDAIGHTHGFLYEGGTFSSIDFPGASETYAIGINNSGDLVGWFTLTIQGPARGFLYSGGSFTTIDFPGASQTIASGINDSGKITGFYFDATGHHGFLASPWTISTIDSAGDVGPYSSIAIDSNDRIHISYLDQTNKDLKYATNISGSWTTFTIDAAGDVGFFTSLAIDSNNKVHITYCNQKLNGDLKYATDATGAWETFTLIAGAGAMFSSVAVDSNNALHISYFDNVAADLKYATNISGSWETLTIDSGWYIWWTSIAIDSNNHAHISYYANDETNGALKYATNVSGSWETFTIDSTGPLAQAPTSLAVDSNNRVHISYRDSNGILKYATNISGVWETSTIDGTGDSGYYSSIAIDLNDKVHIGYFDNGYSDLKYATNAQGPWVTSIIDSMLFGGYPSIAIDSNNKVHISYYDTTNGDLKYATNATVCTGPTITTQPQSQTIQSGQTASMSVSASGTTPLSYQWYLGATENTSTPVGANSNIYTTPALTQTASYWVRAINACGSVDSNTATVTVATAGISVVSPNSGETWPVGSAQTIRWSYNATPGAYVKIELLKGGVVNRIIRSLASKGTGGTGSCNWTIPANQTPGTDYRIRVTSTNGAYTDTSDSDFTIAAPTITVVSPNGGETLTTGTTQTIRWSYTGNPGSYVKIELLKGGAVNRIIRSFAWKGSGENGSYNWHIPSTLVPGSDYQIRVTSTTYGGCTYTSDSDFTIAAPTVTVVSPNGGETLTAGATQTIRWTYHGNPGSYVKIELLKGGVVNRTIKSFVWKGTDGTGSFNWRIPANQAAGTDYSIRVTSTSDNSYSDTSDSSFIISK